ESPGRKYGKLWPNNPDGSGFGLFAKATDPEPPLLDYTLLRIQLCGRPTGVFPLGYYFKPGNAQPDASHPWSRLFGI
ncbi:MAG: hypothetical protein ACPGPS_14930, partial [Rubripirellula sp.]